MTDTICQKCGSDDEVCREALAGRACAYTGAAPAPVNPLKALLDEAIETVAARGKPYGGVEDNFGRIARLWQGHLANRYNAHAMFNLDATDVALMMALVKVARLANDPSHRDSWVDIAGYAACGGSIAQKPVDKT